MSFTLPQVIKEQNHCSNPACPCILHVVHSALKAAIAWTNQPASLRRDDEPKELQCVFVFFVLALFCIDGVISLETTPGQCTQVFKGAYR